MQPDHNDKLVSLILDIGESMLSAGAEVSRIENTMFRIAEAYGFLKIDAFALTTLILFTVHTNDEKVITQTRHINRSETNMQLLAKMNALSRKICKNPLSIEELEKEILNIQQLKTYPEWMLVLVWGMVAGVFAVFFGGDVYDGIAGFISGVILRISVQYLTHLHVKMLVVNFFCSMVISLCAIITTRIGIGHDINKIVIGTIMLLIPGVALTTSLRDMINGDIISGLLGFCDAILRAIVIAAGIVFVSVYMGGA